MKSRKKLRTSWDTVTHENESAEGCFVINHEGTHDRPTSSGINGNELITKENTAKDAQMEKRNTTKAKEESRDDNAESVMLKESLNTRKNDKKSMSQTGVSAVGSSAANEDWRWSIVEYFQDPNSTRDRKI
jgi:hypothetical protein